MAEKERADPFVQALAGWQPARVLMAANRLGIFAVLGENALPAEEVASRCGCQPRSMALLLNACVALGFLTKARGLYSNTLASLYSLVPGKPTYLGDAINHSDHLWAAWSHLDEAVRTNHPVRQAPFASDPTVHRDFILAMHNRAMRIGPLLADALDLSGRRQLFDAGGGPGTFSIFLVRRYPGLRAIVFDLPPTIEIARQVIASSGVADRIALRAGDYFKDDLGQGNDVVLLSAVLHALGPARCQELLNKAYHSLVSGGLVVVHEQLIDRDGTSPLGAVLFSLNMLVNTEAGQSYSAEEITGWMRKVGFQEPRVKPLPAPARASMVIATKP